MLKYLKHNFSIDNMAMRYSVFAPRLFNFCLSLGMEPQKIMPSRAFCSDENQGYPIILITKHFGTFPFNHGRVGGIVAIDRHTPHSEHGKDMVIIQASHVGYNPQTGEFGIYRRMQTEEHEHAADCGAICGVMSWYQEEYDFACKHIHLEVEKGIKYIVIDNQLLTQNREQGLFLHLHKLIENYDPDEDNAVRSYSTARAYPASKLLIKRIGEQWPVKRTPIEVLLDESLFYFKRNVDMNEASGYLNRNLLKSMSQIITSKFPSLVAAQVNTQIEFDRTFRSLVKEKSYRGKKLVFISGIHIDISPKDGELFPLTKFVPWAAYIQTENGEGYTLEQKELFLALNKQSNDNPHKIDLTAAIHKMEAEAEIQLSVDKE